MYLKTFIISFLTGLSPLLLSSSSSSSVPLFPPSPSFPLVSISEEKYAIAQGTISRLEKQWEDNIQSNKDLMASIQLERNRATMRFEQSEGKVNDLIKQNTLSQVSQIRPMAFTGLRFIPL